MPSDADYQQTKRLKRTGASLPSPFREIAEWVSSNFEVDVLNVIYDTVIPDDRPRLSVILELDSHAQKFRDGALGNFNRVDQKRVAERFERILAEHGGDRFNCDGLFVVFSAFEGVARIEANESVTDGDVSKLKSKLGNEDIWEISRCFDGVTIFFYTDAQVKLYEDKGLRDSYAQEYASVISRHDEFGYIAKRGVSVSFDSKENFDTNFQGNWYYYYK